MRILFYDGLTPFPYDAELMLSRGIGGTESTVVRIAEGLSVIHEIAVAQRARSEPASPQPGLRYVPLNEPQPFGTAPPDWIIVLRKHRHVPMLRARFPSADMILWIHNWQRAEAAIQRIGLARSKCAVVTVSEAHRLATEHLINGTPAKMLSALAGCRQTIPVHRVYNPIDERLKPDSTPVDPNKLIFFSTANKGLNQVLSTFAKLYQALPSLRLYVAGETLESLESNPRYGDLLLKQPGIELLGRLPQHELFRHVRESLCVFYPQNMHPETFGLVFAESNALGTPVLAHDFGSAREILGSDEQLIETNDTQGILARLQKWQNGERPQVSLRQDFKLERVIKDWRRLLEQRTTGAPA